MSLNLLGQSISRVPTGKLCCKLSDFLSWVRKKKDLFLIMYMSVVCFYVCAPCAHGDWRVHKRASRTPKTRITDGCEPPCGFWGPNSWPLQEWLVCLPHWIVSLAQKLGSLLRIKEALNSILQCTSQHSLKDTKFEPHMRTLETVMKD